MKIYLIASLVLLFSLNLFGQKQAQQWPPELTEVWEPVPPVVKTGAVHAPPSDAIVLFDGSNLDHWVSSNDGKSAAPWTVGNGAMTCKPGKGGIKTKEQFGDIQLHLEFRTPKEVTQDGQDRGNSGLFFQERYEVQILDNYDNRTYSNGQCASIYKQSIPLANACKKPGEWQTYDIIYMAPRFNDDGIKIQSGYLTVFHNGVLVQNHVEIKGTTEYIGLPKNIAHGKGSIALQDHGNTTSFRNIWLREL